MIKLSVVVITHNEEHNLPRCLESVKEIADEIVVVDSFSTDNTKKICESFGGRFIEHAFEGHIQQKNWAITQATYPHILSLDADEAPDEVLKRSILAVKENWKADGYTFNRLTYYCGKWIRHCGWYPDVKLRLWDSRKGRWGGTNPHDKYEMDKGSRIIHLKGDLLHYSYYTREQHYKQTNYFTDIAAKAMYSKGKKVSFVKIGFSPIVRFLRDYFLKLGILDGYEGLVISAVSAYATYLKYKKLKILWKQNSKS